MASDPEGFCELYRDYLSDARQTLNSLRVACDAKNGEELHFKAHYLKSSSLVLGVPSVAQFCVELENLGRASEFAVASRKLGEFGELLNRVQSDLERKLGPQVRPAAA
jgi:HPt (histidine-containing phosphotransfer) domain-containing protein